MEGESTPNTNIQVPADTIQAMEERLLQKLTVSLNNSLKSLFQEERQERERRSMKTNSYGGSNADAPSGDEEADEAGGQLNVPANNDLQEVMSVAASNNIFVDRRRPRSEVSSFISSQGENGGPPSTKRSRASRNGSEMGKVNPNINTGAICVTDEQATLDIGEEILRTHNSRRISTRQ